MEPGDLIRWRGQVWLVRKVDRELATAIVEADRHMEVLASDADQTGECEVWCKPSQQWPSVALPYRSGASRLVGVHRADIPLIRFVDWVKLDDFQVGGSLYLNPILPLHFGDRVTVVFSSHRGLVNLPVSIPRNYTPLPNRRSPSTSERGCEPILTTKPTPALFARLKRNE